MSCHHDKYGALTGKIREDKTAQLRASLGKQQDFFQKPTKTAKETVRASFIISHLNAKSAKAFTDGLFAKNCLHEAADAICPSYKISLSSNLFERIMRWATTLKTLWCKDVSTDIAGRSRCAIQCAVFIRVVDRNLGPDERHHYTRGYQVSPWRSWWMHQLAGGEDGAYGNQWCAINVWKQEWSCRMFVNEACKALGHQTACNGALHLAPRHSIWNLP